MPAPALGFLDDHTQVKIPVGGDFVPSGLIGTWKARVMFRFYSKTDIGMVEGIAIQPAMIRHAGDGWFYYYRDRIAADQALTAMGEEIKNSQQVWNWFAPLKSIANFPDEETRAKFNDPLTFDLRIASLQSKKHRHELHMIALPAIVYAASKALGFEVPPVTFNELISANNPNRTDTQTIFDDAFQVKMIGNSNVDANPNDPQHYTKSLLWKQRAALWEALDESDASKYQTKGTKTKFDTTSDKLSSVLTVLTHEWKGAVWGRLINVPSPVVDAIYGQDEQKRLAIPALIEMFADEKSAKSIAEKELKERAERKSATEATENAQATGCQSVASPDGDLPIPDEWKEFKNEWQENIGKLVEEYKGKPAPAILKALKVREGEFSATAEQLLAAMKAYK